MSAESINGSFGDELKTLREGIQLSQAAFAEVMNIGEDPPLLHQSSVSRMEDGIQFAPANPRFWVKLATLEGVGDIGARRLLLRGMLGQLAPRVIMNPDPGIMVYMDVDTKYSDSEADLLRASVQVSIEDFIRSRLPKSES